MGEQSSNFQSSISAHAYVERERERRKTRRTRCEYVVTVYLRSINTARESMEVAFTRTNVRLPLRARQAENNRSQVQYNYLESDPLRLRNTDARLLGVNTEKKREKERKNPSGAVRSNITIDRQIDHGDTFGFKTV